MARKPAALARELAAQLPQGAAPARNRRRRKVGATTAPGASATGQVRDDARSVSRATMTSARMTIRATLPMMFDDADDTDDDDSRIDDDVDDADDVAAQAGEASDDGTSATPKRQPRSRRKAHGPRRGWQRGSDQAPAPDAHPAPALRRTAEEAA